MKPRALLIVVSFGVLVATVAMVGRQRQQLQDLRSKTQELQLRTAALTDATPAETSEPVVVATHSGPSLELLRLRSQVGQLERRKRELSVVTEENKRLQAQVVASATNITSVPLPPGYIRKSKAKFAGFASPEDSLHSFLWAIEHRDLPTLMQFFSPEQAKQITAEVERRGSSEDFFKEAGVVPGLLVTGREPKDDGTIELTVQIVPNDEASTQKMRFKQFDGQWRLISGF